MIDNDTIFIYIYSFIIFKICQQNINKNDRIIILHEEEDETHKGYSYYYSTVGKIYDQFKTILYEINDTTSRNILKMISYKTIDKMITHEELTTEHISQLYSSISRFIKYTSPPPNYDKVSEYDQIGSEYIERYLEYMKDILLNKDTRMTRRTFCFCEKNF